MTTESPVTTKKSGRSTPLADSMNLSTSASGTRLRPRIARPAMKPPNTGCRPSEAVTQALPMASVRAAVTWPEDGARELASHQPSSRRTTTSMNVTKAAISSSVSGQDRPAAGLLSASATASSIHATTSMIPAAGVAQMLVELPGQPSEKARAQQDAGDDLADDGGLADPPGCVSQHRGRRHDDRNVGKDIDQGGVSVHDSPSGRR